MQRFPFRPACAEHDHACFDHAPGRAHLLWQTAMVFPACACAAENSTLTLWECVLALVSTMTVMVLDGEARRALPDPDGDGDPGSPHHGITPGFWGAEIVHLVYLAVTAYFFARAVLCVAVCFQFRANPYSPIAEFDTTQRHLRPLQRLVWAAHVVALPASVTALVVYATTLRHDDRVSPLTTASYALNASWMLLDMLFWNMPLLSVHLVWSFALGWAYALFTLVYYAHAIPAEAKYPYIYNALDWSQPLRTLGNALGISLLHAGIYMSLVVVTTLRQQFSGVSPFQTFEQAPPPPTRGLATA